MRDQAVIPPGRLGRRSLYAALLATAFVAGPPAALLAFAADRLTVEALWARAQNLGSTVDGIALTLKALPVGAIVVWAGSIDSLPAGWVLCDGQNSTPDLRGRFVIGASNATLPHSIGGSSSHVHAPTIHAHDHVHDHFLNSTVLAAKAGAHNHILGQLFGASEEGWSPISDNIPGGRRVEAHYFYHHHDVNSEDGHSHTFKDSHGDAFLRAGSTEARTEVSTFESESAEHVPPYFALAYIMKVSAGN